MKTGQRLVRAIIVLEIAWMLLAAVSTPWRSDLPVGVVLRPYFLPLAAVVFLVSSLFMSKKTQILIVLCTLPGALVLLSLELALGSPSRRLERAFQRTSQVPVLRADGISVFPILAPWDLAYGHRVVSTPHGDALPLTGLPSRPTALCQLHGASLVFQSDSLGMRNPSSTHSARGGIALLGDSFAEGYCVTDSSSIAGHLAGTFGPVQNFGVTGASALWELGVLREFVSQTQPKVIVWTFFEGNDLEGIDAEVSGFAGHYLDPDFTQNLASRRGEIETALLSRLDSLGNSFDLGAVDRLRQLVLLREIRARIALSIRPPEAALARSGTPVQNALPVLRKILTIARDETARWGGRIVFVYLPERDRYTAKMMRVPESSVGGHHSAHPAVIALVDSLAIDVVDMSPIFASQSAPLRLFDEGGIHYNAAGYKLVADSIASYIGRHRQLLGIVSQAGDEQPRAISSDRWMKFTSLSAASIVRGSSIH